MAPNEPAGGGPLGKRSDLGLKTSGVQTRACRQGLADKRLADKRLEDKGLKTSGLQRAQHILSETSRRGCPHPKGELGKPAGRGSGWLSLALLPPRALVSGG
jgi:hypothetical protein